MAKKAKLTGFKNEPLILIGSVFNQQTQDLAATFAQSSQVFIDRLEFLRRKLEGQFERYSDDGGLTSRQRWNPPEYFNCCIFAMSAHKTHEAWNASRRLNLQLDAFDGATILKLVRLFEEMQMTERQNSIAAAPAELSVEFFKFECEVDRFKLLLAISKPNAEQTQKKKPPNNIRASENDLRKFDFYEKARHKSPHVTYSEVAIQWNRQFKNEEQTEQGMRQAVNRGKKFKDWQRDNS